MRLFVTSLIGIAIAGGLATTAAAEPFQRYAAGAALVGLDTEFSEQTRRPGPAIAIDVMRTPWDAPVAVGGHLGFGLGFNHRRLARDFPMNADYREIMLQLGLLVEVKHGPVALGVGLNLDNHHSTLTARDDGTPAGVTDSQRALGSMVQLAIDAVATRHGTVVVVGNVDRYGLPDVLGWISNGDASARTGTTYMLGVAFRPR